jgi:uncharacterized lipoprotein YajG
MLRFVPISMQCVMLSCFKRTSLRTLTALALIVFVLLLSGCERATQTLAIPDQSIPHRIAAPTTVQIYVRTINGMTIQTVQAQEGWWIASPTVMGE